MRRLMVALCAASCLLTARPTYMDAQAGSYDENALWLDPSRAEITVVRGVSGNVVGKLGLFRGADLETIVSPSANAVTAARIFKRDYRPGMLLGCVGIVTLGAAIGASRIPDINQLIPTGLTIVSVGLMGYGGARLGQAYRALAKSIWWYNRDLSRENRTEKNKPPAG